MYYFSLCSTCCLLFFSKVLNLAFRNQHPVNPRRQCNVPATWGLLQTAAIAEYWLTNCASGDQHKGAECIVLPNEVQLERVARESIHWAVFT